MQPEGAAKQVARWVALGALFIIPLAPLIVAHGFFFPFITGKGFYLRIVIEIAVGAWVVLALLDKAYRPRFSWIGVAVLAFVAWMFIADSFAINAAKAFWSNFERMEGWVLLIHLLGFFFAASAVLRVEKKWRAWFLTSLAIAAIICAYALLQLAGRLEIHQGSTRIDATLGNSIYLGIYLLFTTFVAGWLALTEKRPWLKWMLIALAVLSAVLIFFTGTRGTIVGLLGALALTALLTALTAGRRARLYAVGALLLLALIAGSFSLVRNSSFVQENYVLQRLASISWADLKVRRTIWHIAFEGTMERPVLGWGQEGFNYVFNKYYEPSLYYQEAWFDRAHNTFIDWLTAGGIPALLLYLSLFGTALTLLWRHSELSRPERIALTAALMGYAVHNFFVFDNLYSYIYFFAILALVDSQVSRPLERLEKAGELSASAGATYVLPVAAVILLVVVWTVNVPGIRAASSLIAALSPNPAGISGNIDVFQRLAANPSFAGQEIREQLVSFAVGVAQSNTTTVQEKQRAAALAVAEMEKQVARYPLDARGYLQLSYAYRAAGDGEKAFRALEAALELSPKKQQFWIEAGMLAWDLGDAKIAQVAFATAHALDPSFSEVALYAAAGSIAIGDTPAAHVILNAAYGTTTVDVEILAIAYIRTKNWPELIALLTRRTEAPGAGPSEWFSLASAYYAAGDKANAIKAINTAIARYPEAAAAGAAAIKEINEGT